MISSKERGRENVEEQAHGGADDRGAQASCELIQFLAFEKVQHAYFFAKCHQLPEALCVPGERHTREINLQERFVGLTVDRAMQDSVNVVQDVQRAEFTMVSFRFMFVVWYEGERIAFLLSVPPFPYSD